MDEIERHATEEYADGAVAAEREIREAAIRSVDGRVSDLADAVGSMPKESDFAALRERDEALDGTLAGLARRIDDVADESVRRDEDAARALMETCERHALESQRADEAERARAQAVERTIATWLLRHLRGLPVPEGDAAALLAAIEEDFRRFCLEASGGGANHVLSGRTYRLSSVRDIYNAVKDMLEALGADKVVGYPERFET